MRSPRGALLALAVGVASAADPGSPPPPPAGSAAAGRVLFIGARRFENGGAPCGACHGIGGEGLAFMASLGPELSTSLAPMDADALDGLLQALPFPTMAPVYDGRPLTPSERADLAAFLIPAARRGPPAGGWRFALSGGVVAVVLFLGLALAWRRRKAPTRARLLSRAAQTQGGSR